MAFPTTGGTISLTSIELNDKWVWACQPIGTHESWHNGGKLTLAALGHYFTAPSQPIILLCYQ